MDDSQIIDLFLARSENAIAETAKKYGNYCLAIARNLLPNKEDCEECLSDTWLKAWNTIPPQMPERLSAYLGKITRNLSLDRLKQAGRQKRGGGELPLVLEELNDCIPSADTVERVMDDRMLIEALNRFLGNLPVRTRKIFLRRYWYASAVAEIASEFGLGESMVKMTLKRTREDLRNFLKQEGMEL